MSLQHADCMISDLLSSVEFLTQQYTLVKLVLWSQKVITKSTMTQSREVFTDKDLSSTTELQNFIYHTQAGHNGLNR